MERNHAKNFHDFDTLFYAQKLLETFLWRTRTRSYQYLPPEVVTGIPSKDRVVNKERLSSFGLITETTPDVTG